jgi:hypothetical protein
MAPLRFYAIFIDQDFLSIEMWTADGTSSRRARFHQLGTTTGEIDASTSNPR